ncbi:DMT family transporter [Thermanaerothrix sp. 4228-RoL]|jgi:drug/metabolite transporter (DMT)-like permease|uniref:DMT family transporter n=1 Tax=Thermanaerothrix solaris TaxID=3058434 RepID=A0ABU3NSQ9_9CHLR|nr:DMT family transporter [Thermanaerothrix sp. 4228-RoL]MDT8899147.1 DMT family transporter [Thermanaerothrix sp. 4228-RoL]
MWANRRSQGVIAALASALFMGTMPILGKQAFGAGFSPLAVVALRSTIAALLMFGAMSFQRHFFYIYPVGLIGCLIAGVINGIGSIFYYTALVRLDASVGHLIYSFYPLFVALWLWLDRQKIGPITLLRLILALPGIYLLIRTGHTPVDLVGALMMLLSALFYAFHLIINQRILYEAPAPTVTFYTLMAMAVTVGIAFGVAHPTLPPFTLAWWPVLGMAGITFLSRLTLFLGVKNLGGLQTALLGISELLVTVLLAQVWLNERLSPAQWIGALLIAGSMTLVALDPSTPERRTSGGWLRWLNPPQLPEIDLPWQR